MGEGSDVIERLYRPRRVDLESALAREGVSPGEIGAIVNSHLHFDHCGVNGVFRGVPLYVQESEWEAASRQGYTVLEWLDFPGAGTWCANSYVESLVALRQPGARSAYFSHDSAIWVPDTDAR